MAQIGNVHPDDLVPAWHAARQLTPEETETVGRILGEHLKAHLEEMQKFEVDAWLHTLPPIPPRRADRLRWYLDLPVSEGGDYQECERVQRRIHALRRAATHHDYRSALLMMTHGQRSEPDAELLNALRPAWKRELQAIREALDIRIDDALERAVQAKAAEEALAR